ncbi:dihydroorotase [Thalassolituus marinus]|uniref:Dihydroorotase n=1 Tax=Thalassolituus marinus TaxID=671053 RepID=A0ABS7ZN09_9GAMM|nr:dihydroorotase [Thalassolituus marinus]MCA6063104.1 dihydroorotase [Thalassolituus marinus]
MRYLHIENARLIDPASNLDQVTDLYVAEGRIAAIGHKPAGGGIELTIDGQGKWLVPGLVDLGAHLPEPGYAHKGTIASETRAACSSGFTHVCSLPDTKPVTDSSAVVKLILEKASKAGYSKVLPLGALTQGLEGEQLASMFTLHEAGCVALSNARRPFKDSYVLRRVMEYAATYDIPVFLSANDIALSAGGCMHEGPVATRMGLSGIPRTAETIALAQMLLLIEQTGVRAHISQISCARSVAMLQQARNEGLSISADTALANLIYTDDAVNGYNSQFNVQPPLRSESDRQALLAAVNSGELAISSNHQPHEVAAKKAPFADAEPGMSMFDGFLPLALQLVERGELSLTALIRATSTLPAQIAGIEQGLVEGQAFNAALIDPLLERSFRRSELLSKGRNSPLAGQTLKGAVSAVFIEGHQVF